jgi:hypothetical protein
MEMEWTKRESEAAWRSNSRSKGTSEQRREERKGKERKGKGGSKR